MPAMTPQHITDNLQRTVRQGHLVATSLPVVPEISLYLLSHDYPRGRLEHDEMLAIMASPAYWAFFWASGQVLARYILDHPAVFAGKTLLDLGTGSGVVAIAAAMAGATAIACDTDPDALAAAEANARANRTCITLLDNLDGLEEKLDMVLAADVLYDRDNMPLLEKLPALAEQVIIADSRVKADEIEGYRIIGRMTATTVPDLDELREYSNVRIYRAEPTLLSLPE